MFFSCICVDLWSLVVSCNPLLGLLSGMKVMFKKKKKKKNGDISRRGSQAHFQIPLSLGQHKDLLILRDMSSVEF
jgi:hypothetical protein